MPYAATKDGVKLFFQETGSGTPIIFVHEFAGDHRSWEPQVRYFSRYYRCITYNARGYPPSDVPAERGMYSQAIARDDILAVLDYLKIDQAHVIGLSMGGFATLHFGIAHGKRARSVVIAGCGYGAQPGEREKFRAECESVVALFETKGTAETGKIYTLGPTRVQFQNKDSRGWQEFADHFNEHSAQGSALTQRGVQMQRPSIWELIEDMKRIDVPALIVTGDEDEPCLEPGLLMKRTIPTSGLVVLPRTGHAINLEEPDGFNRAVGDFLHAVDLGKWGRRDPRSVGNTILGVNK
jgi:pimeloyl-ACP methyl ester carboxylesterase